MSERAKSLAALCFFLILGAIVFHRALSIGFLGDFAGDIWTSQANWFNFSAYQWNFYVPAMVLYYNLYKVFQLNPWPYHAFQLFFIVFNAWLIYKIAGALGLKAWQCWIAGLLALLNSVASESYFWLSTIPKVVATTLSLIALIFLIRLRRSGSQIWGWSYVTTVTLALTVESTALILPLLGLFLDIYCIRRWRQSEQSSFLFTGYKVHFLTFSITGIFLLIRQFFGIRPYVIQLPLIDKMRTFARTVLSTFYHGLADHIRISKHPDLVLIILFLTLVGLLLWAWKMKSASERRLYVSLLLLWIGACLPHTIGANISSRYFYYPGVFASLFIADLLGTFSHRFNNLKIAYSLTAIVVIIYLSSDLRVFNQSIDSYVNATRIYNAGLENIRTALPKITPDMHLLIIDFPDYLYIRQNPPKHYVTLVYRNALPYHLMLLYKTNKIDVTFLRMSPPSPENPSPLGTPIDGQKLAALMATPKLAAFRYFPLQNEFRMIKRNGNN